MAKFQLTRPGGPWIYDEYGFTAVDGAILDGALSSPTITSPPDANWAVYGGASAETGISRHGATNFLPAYVEPADGTTLAYNAGTNQWEYRDPASIIDTPSARAAFDADYAAKATQTEVETGRLSDAALSATYASRKGVTGAYDGLVASMRPTKFLKTYTVDGSIAASIPALRLYKTYAEAYNQSLADAKGYFNNATADLARLTPDMWHRIIVNPGVYLERVPIHNFLAVVNPTGNWDDVIFRDAGDAATGGVLDTSGRTFWGYGFTVDYTGTDRQWHAHRDGGGDGTFTNIGGQRRLVLLDNMKLWVSSSSANAEACATDCGVGAGAVAVYNRVWFKADAVPQVVSVVMGAGSDTAAPGMVAILNPIIDSNHLPSNVDAGQFVGINHPVGLVSSSSTRKDKIIWAGGTWDVGDPTYAVGSSALPAGGQLGNFSNISCVVNPTTGTDFYVDPAVAKVVTFLSTDSSKVDIPNNIHQHREVYVPVLPDHGVTRLARDYYGDGVPALIDKTRLAHPTTSTARRTLTANRIYYVKVPIFSQFLPGRISLGATVTAVGGKFAAAFVTDNAGLPDTTNLQAQAAFPVTTMFPVGDRVTATMTSKQPLPPGQGYVWLAFATDDATATFESVLSPTLGVEVRYKDGWAGGTLTNHTSTSALPDGAAVPLPVLHAMQEVVAVYEANGTFTIPLGARALRIEGYGAGGGGGGGRRGAAASVRAGGAGGAGGAHSILTIPTWRLPATLSIAVGAAGVAGAAATADDTNGGAGGAGGQSYVQANGKYILRAQGGPGGAGGAQAAAAGGAAQTGTDGAAGAGASSSATGGGGSSPSNTYAGAPGGGAGGGITTGNAASAGGGGAFVFNQTDEVNVSGGAIDTFGTMGHSTASGYGPGNSGSGGGSSLAGPGGAGGDGGYWGAGGGGGGASTNGQNSGAGGKGAPGIVIITAIF